VDGELPVNDEHHPVEPADNGDMAVFCELVKNNRDKIFRLAYDLTGNRRDAEDLSQEVFTKVYRSFGTFRGDSDAGSWLYRITVNCWTDRKRRKSLPTADFNDEISREYSNHNWPAAEHATDNPEHVLQMTTIQVHIDQALRKLTKKQRAIFVLHHYNGLPIKEIAAIFMMSEGTVKSLLHRSLKKLRRELSFYRPDLGLEETE
jgi:RNA polymerase sigma-70 factor (ECF subfamily)